MRDNAGAPRFYVYALIDPITESRFYIGKGTGRRAFSHERAALNGAVGPRYNKIRKLARVGVRPTVEIVGRFHDEDEAYAFEASLIEAAPPGSLLNIAKGGRSVYPHAEANHDKQMCQALAVFCHKTKGLHPGIYRFWLFQKWHELPASFIEQIRERLRQLADKYGDEWVEKTANIQLARA